MNDHEPQSHGITSEPYVIAWIQRHLIKEKGYTQVVQTDRDDPRWMCRSDLVYPGRYVVDVKCPWSTDIRDPLSWFTWCQMQASLGIHQIPYGIIVNAKIRYTTTTSLSQTKDPHDRLAQGTHELPQGTQELPQGTHELPRVTQELPRVTHDSLLWLRVHTSLSLYATTTTGTATTTTGIATTTMGATTRSGQRVPVMVDVCWYLIPALPSYYAYMKQCIRESPPLNHLQSICASRVSDYLGLTSTTYGHGMLMSNPRHAFRRCRRRPVAPHSPHFYSYRGLVSERWMDMITMDHMEYIYRHGRLPSLLEDIGSPTKDVRSGPTEESTKDNWVIELPDIDRMGSLSRCEQLQIQHSLIVSECMLEWRPDDPDDSMVGIREWTIRRWMNHDPHTRMVGRWTVTFTEGSARGFTEGSARGFTEGSARGFTEGSARVKLSPLFDLTNTHMIDGMNRLITYASDLLVEYGMVVDDGFCVGHAKKKEDNTTTRTGARSVEYWCRWIRRWKRKMNRDGYGITNIPWLDEERNRVSKSHGDYVSTTIWLQCYDHVHSRREGGDRGKEGGDRGKEGGDRGKEEMNDGSRLI